MTTPQVPKIGFPGDPSRPGVTLEASALSLYPGPAVLLSPDGMVVASNGRAEPLGVALAQGRLTNLAALIATPSPGSVIETVMGPNGAPMILDLVALPCDNGAVLVLGRDVTLERNLRSALVESRQRYKDLVEISSDFAWEIGADRCFSFISPKGALGFPGDALVGRRPEDFVIDHVEGGQPSPFSSSVAVVEAEVWMKLANGGESCLLLSSAPVLDEHGQWRGARGVCRDVTQERLRDSALTRANNRERLLSYIVRTIRDEVVPADMLAAAAEATARALGATACHIHRIPPDGTDFILSAHYGEGGNDLPVLDSFLEHDHFEGEMHGRQVLAAVCRYGQSINGAVILWRDHDRGAWSDDERLLIDDVANQVGLANEQIANHERIVRLSRTDSLTGLFNRRAFFDEIARRFDRLAHDGKPAALIYVDLDNFKLVNDAHGHQTGDQALTAVRDLLVQHTRPIDVVARLGGDEFAVWLEGADEGVASERCQVLLAGASLLDRYSGSAEHPLHMSLGLAVHCGTGPETLDELIARADKAMYEVKRHGKGRWQMAPPPAQRLSTGETGA